MARAGEGSFGRQVEYVLQEVIYSGGEATGNATEGGGVVGGYQPLISQTRLGICMRDLRAGALGIAVEVEEEGGFGGVGEEVGIFPGLGR